MERSLVLDTSENLEEKLFVVSSWIASERIFAASARLIGASGRKVPSLYHLIHLFFTAKAIYSVYQAEESISANGVSVPW